ncbi:hypothetical protein V1264_007470 [Littorina saxatilis]|uniref:Uncharacterized protein n=1 Tax=Littorina saxatilis TaxID=31220 RepID=A0AAN9AV45_9CAEN
MQSEGYSPSLPLYVQGPKTRCVSVAGRLQLRDTTTSACRRRGHNGPCPDENASNIRRLWAKEEEEE